MHALKRKIRLFPGPSLFAKAGAQELPQKEEPAQEAMLPEEHAQAVENAQPEEKTLAVENVQPEEKTPADGLCAEEMLPHGPGRDDSGHKAEKRPAGQRGFTLIEVLGALVVGSLVFGFAAFAISKAIESARVTSFNENLALLRINVHEVYASSRGFGSSSSAAADITGTLVSAGAIPDPWLDKDSNTTLHTLGGEVSVSGTLTGFTITAKSINQDACRKIASSQAENWDKITINGETVDSVPTNLCSSDDAGAGTNTMAFTAH